MIKSNELRKGVFIYSKDMCIREILDFKIEKGECLFRYELSNGNIIRHHLKTAKPIPLTEEWLLKFGFKKGATNEFNNIDINKESFIYANFWGDFDCGVGIEDNDEQMSTSLNIKYVHQLQNLYHALTGEELQPSN